MHFFLTLIASEKSLSAGHLAGIERYLDSQGIDLASEPSWLNPHRAADLPISDCLNTDQMVTLREALSTDRIDVLCSCAGNRRKKLLVADMDSTIVESETLDELATHAGLKEKISAITQRAMNGELDFQQALRERVALLKGLPVRALEETLTATRIASGAEVLVNTMRKTGASCVLVSGGFTFFTSAIAARVGFTDHHGNVLDIQDNVLTGDVREPILDKESKLHSLFKHTQVLKLRLEDTLAIGDGANDIPMLAHAGLGIGYRPKPVVENEIRNSIRYTDLRSVLYAQGFRAEEFIA